MLGGVDNPNGELLSYIIGADTVQPEQEASPQWQPREATRWGAGLLADS